MRGAIFYFFALCFLLFLTLLAGRHSDSTPGNYCCFLTLLCVSLKVPTDISGHLVERGTGRNGHRFAVEWISACVWYLVPAYSSSWYVLYLFVRFSFGLLSTCVTTGWIFEISLSENSIQFNPLYGGRWSPLYLI